ncbi:AMP-binding protein [Flectobacillus rivi]|uniref:AMP-binding protein n=1 Tax=Flectobacillus rivi TaxID=2984209 RepID=A0ABT6Z6F2_9BACT|nr:AMP-binding protein [Flectobacillus rivi]MDI9876709.1 AMP-binding protein [Flectobacillus rivi]
MKRQFKSMVENFCHWETHTPDSIFLKQPHGTEFRDFSYQEAGQQIRKMAQWLLSQNLPPRSNIGILSKNCAHWIMTDLAISMAGHVSVPFYPTLTDEQLRQVLVHSDCQVLFVGKLDAWESMKGGIPTSIRCVSYPSYYEGAPSEFENWESITKITHPLASFALASYEEVSSIVYTSGTTGVPKGVMLTHQGLISALEHTREVGLLDTSNARFFSYLPLCHIAERTLVESAGIASGGTIYFAESLDTFASNLQTANPTHFLAVPRIWTKFQLGILSKLPQSKLDLLLKIPIVKSIIRNKVKKGLGLAKAELILTGAAPMPSSLLEWFHKLDIQIREAYGMTENMGVATIMPPKYKKGTVGKPHNGVTIKIDPNTQELLMKAPWNTVGYYKEPIMTQELFKDGWLATGDMASIDEEGYISIIGRVKDMFKSAKGEYIVPTPIEGMLAVNPIIEQVCVVGTGLPQPIALVVLSEIGKNTEETQLREVFREMIKRVNPHFKNYEHLRKIVVVKEAWSVENNMLTPTLKIKRNVIEKHYHGQLEKWFESPEEIVFEN